MTYYCRLFLYRLNLSSPWVKFPVSSIYKSFCSSASSVESGGWLEDFLPVSLNFILIIKKNKLGEYSVSARNQSVFLFVTGSLGVFIAARRKLISKIIRIIPEVVDDRQSQLTVIVKGLELSISLFRMQWLLQQQQQQL